MDINEIAELVTNYGLPILFVLAYVEGGVAMLAGGFLAKVGVFSFETVVLILILADFFGDIGSYTVAYFGGSKIITRWGKWIGLSQNRYGKLRKVMEKDGGKMIMLTRFATGISWATVIVAGLMKMKLKKFLFFDLMAVIIWVFTMAGIGYLFAASIQQASDTYNSLGLIVSMVLVIGISWYVYKKIKFIIEEEVEEEINEAHK